ncbi:hypothetical protein OESDEN_10276 [Oesophagostomum dentatum]|uniref:Uncharacterized protein n=1 Tax=Oesophagostomum dentatum TaxID=61180 RepID=A0A0B1SX52_OESDE|nr:hypothetical protein OESDEN_10276 [Oesophagostomum dentatum]
MASSNCFELLCIVLLGLGQMCIMTGKSLVKRRVLQSFVAESVLHSVSRREPDRIDPHAGYYGQATCFGFYMLACIFAPWILSRVSPKWTLFLGSVCYTLYQVGFLYLNNYYYYTTCAIMGVGFARKFSPFTFFS